MDQKDMIDDLVKMLDSGFENGTAIFVVKKNRPF